MALTRFNGNVVPFASESTTDNRTVFGDVVQADDIDSNLNADFKKGWEIVGLNDNPTKQDFNAMGYTLGALTSYLYQMGIAEYNASQEYKLNGLCIGTDGTIYQSLVDANIGNALNDGTKWKNVTESYVALTGNQTIAGVKTFSSSPIVPTPTTGTQAVNKDYADTKTTLVQANSYDLGVGQTWQNVTASRTFGVTYTNNTGKPIEVSIIFDSVNTSAQSRLIIDGIIIQDIFFGSGAEGSMSNIIPNNSTYSIVIVTGFTIRQWNELR